MHIHLSLPLTHTHTLLSTKFSNQSNVNKRDCILLSSSLCLVLSEERFAGGDLWCWFLQRWRQW
jgi:hypothetical protein